MNWRHGPYCSCPQCKWWSLKQDKEISGTGGEHPPLSPAAPIGGLGGDNLRLEQRSLLLFKEENGCKNAY